MSKIARAARVASRQRPESVLDNKTIETAETGELFFLGDVTETKTITLPAVQEGAYFRFQFSAQLDDTSGQYDIVAAGSAKIRGTLINVVYAGSSANTTVATNKDDGSDTKITLTDDIHVGSYVEIYCDGTDWQASGVLIGSALNNGVFA